MAIQQQVIISREASGNLLEWVDVLSPTVDELAHLADAYKVPRHLMLSALEPDHMPTLQEGEGYRFIVIRTYDAAAPPEADTVHELTRKITLFIGPDWLLTLHRSRMTWLTQLIDELATCGIRHEVDVVVDTLIQRALQTYELPVEALNQRIDGYEEAVFIHRHDNLAVIKDLFYLKRRIFLLRRMLKGAQEITELLPDVRQETKHHELQYYVNKLVFRYDELVELVSSLMSLNVSLSDHRTNEVMRVLTLFSVFFLPLTFIAGIYGMNFEFMPELQYHYAYPAVLLVMLLTVVILYFWFKRKGWLKN